MKRPPTDRELLKLIYERYYEEFDNFDPDNKTRSSKLHVPIDCVALGEALGVDEDIVFGRLYYHLNKKFGYKQDDGAHVDLFSMQIGKDRHTINFPLMASVLADLEQANTRFVLPILISSLALLLSLVSFALNMV